MPNIVEGDFHFETDGFDLEGGTNLWTFGPIVGW